MSRIYRNLRTYLNYIFFIYTEASVAVMALIGLVIEAVCYFGVDAFWQPFTLVGVTFFGIALIASIRTIVNGERESKIRRTIFS